MTSRANESWMVCRRCGTPLPQGEPFGGHSLACLFDAALDQEGSAASPEHFDHYRLCTHPQPQRTCPSCGNELSGAVEFCPVCMLRQALGREGESTELMLEHSVEPTPKPLSQRFEHY